MSFCSPSYFPANDCCFACVSFHIPVFPSIPCTSRFVPHFLFQNSVERRRSRFLLQRTSFNIPLPFPPAFSYPVLPFVPVLSIFVPHFLSQNPVEHARSRSLLQRTSFPLPFLLVRFCIVNFTFVVSVLCFSSFVLLGFC